MAATYVRRGPGRVGSSYLKCLYRGYTDASFAHLIARPATERYLGMLGPVIHAEVGDTVKVVFVNACPFPTSVHVHGLFYAKADEGAPVCRRRHGRRGHRRRRCASRRALHLSVARAGSRRAGAGPDRRRLI